MKIGIMFGYKSKLLMVISFKTDGICLPFNIHQHNPEVGEYYGGIPIVGEIQGQSWVRFLHFILNARGSRIVVSPR